MFFLATFIEPKKNASPFNIVPECNMKEFLKKQFFHSLYPLLIKCKILWYDCKIGYWSSKDPEEESTIFKDIQRPKDRKQEIAKINGKIEFYNYHETLVTIIEVTTEASIQMYILSILQLPSILDHIDIIYYEWDISLEFISILSSLIMIIRSYFKIKNLTKKYAINAKNGVILFFSMIMSTISRLMLVGIFLYSTNKTGRSFSPLLAILIYYIHVIVMVVFNVLFNTAKPSMGKKNTYLDYS